MKTLCGRVSDSLQSLFNFSSRGGAARALCLAAILALPLFLAAQAGKMASVEGQLVGGADNAPVRRATITLQLTNSPYAVRPGQPPRADSMTRVSQAETDDQGHFTFTNLRTGGYIVTVQRQGYVRSGAAMGPASELWLGEGQKLTGYVIHATAQAVIAGKVLDEFGDPVMGAQVYAQTAAGDGRGLSGGSVQTNDLGEYRIAGLSAGEYLVVASYQDRSRSMYANQRPPEGPQMVYTATYHPAATDRAQAETVRVAAGATVSGVDIKLGKTRAYSVHVKVDDPGAPSGINSYPNLRSRETTPVNNQFFQASRQEDGSFWFWGVPPGDYVVAVQRPQSVGPGSAPAPVLQAMASVDVKDHDVEGVTVRFLPNVELTGVVKSDPPGECGTTGVSVQLRQPTGVYYGRQPQPAQVGEDSRFTLNDVSRGEWQIYLNPMSACYLKSVSYGGTVAAGDTVTVSEGAPLELTLAPYNASVSVSVVDAAGNPAARARVTLRQTQSSTTTLTQANGTATFGRVRPGTYEVLAVENGGQIPGNAYNASMTDSRATKITVGGSGRVTVQVTAVPAAETAAMDVALPGMKGSLAGKVLSAADGAAVAGVAITLRGLGFNGAAPQVVSAESDAQGRFSFAELAPGSYNVTAIKQRYAGLGPSVAGGAPVQVVVGEGQQVADYVLKMMPMAVIAGTVKDEAGQPVMGARVQAYRFVNQVGQPRMMSTGAQTTDDLGNYRLFGLTPGNYYVQVMKESERGLNAPIRAGVVGSAVTTEGSAFMGAGPQQSISISSGAAPPSPVAPASTPDTITGTIPTDETAYLPLWYPNSAQQAGAAAIRVVMGANLSHIDFTWRRSHVVRLRGKVMNAGTGSVSVTIEPAGFAMSYPVATAVVARDGTFEISGVGPGSYVLVARPMVQVMFEGALAAPSSGPSSRLAAQLVEVKDAPMEGIQLEMGDGRTVKGTIRMDDGSPVPQQHFFSLISESFGSAQYRPGTGDAFTLGGVRSLPYLLDARNLPAGVYVKSIRYGGQDVPLSGFSMNGSGDLEVVLGAAGIVEGSIVNATGGAAVEAGITVAPASGSGQAHTGNADEDGNFYFGSLPPGEYRVAAFDSMSPEGYDPPESLAAYASYAKTVTVGAKGDEKVQVTVVPARP
ncbi:MAG TPA: carboxypeptidase-like regulatory domain-containing protein [Bryobacteraceae bacterium]|nr:carboxypeptidase-like regulatory domain-containing protein [Bryobacteraceae bacterium]